MQIVLASGSPRRRELLERAGLSFSVQPSTAEELHDAQMAPDALCEANAELKARAVVVPGAAVIGADTLVFLDEEPLGKPADFEQAHAMLRRLSGRTHTVCSGVCVIRPDGECVKFHELTQVRFRAFGDEVIEAYFSLVDPLDKAGSYGIQEHGELLVEEIEGDFDNVMGLPVSKLLGVLRACGEAPGDLQSSP